MIQFYLPDIASDPVLPVAESGHCVRVLRMKAGDELVCVDGRGTRYTCCITEANPRAVALSVVRSEYIAPHWPCRITLLVAPTKNIDRIEWLLEKCTEMGVDEIIPVKCARSERKEVKPDRLNRILVSAMKQSLKTHLPLLREMTPLTAALSTTAAAGRFICYCSDEFPRLDLCKTYKAGEDVAILIGPEGDFAPDEVHEAVKLGWVPVTLGESRLRTETAGMMAVAAIHTINQRTL